jgi:hypothetical protein
LTRRELSDPWITLWQNLSRKATDLIAPDEQLEPGISLTV